MTRGRTLLAACVLTVVSTLPAAAQTADPNGIKIPPLAPHLAVRPFFLFSEQRMAASDTFEAIFGSPVQPFWGGGAQLAWSSGLYVEGTVSRFSKSGERAFVLDGNVSSLGIPLEATITPIEIAGGYRFGADFSNKLTPYLGAGYASYKYTESSNFDSGGDSSNDTQGHGYLVVGGAEFRVAKWVVISADVQYTHVGGVLGEAGLSKELGENNLGGIAARFRVIIGR